MKSRYKTLIEIQTEAVEAILAARTQGNRASSYGMTTLNKNPRVLRGIRKGYEKQVARQGWSAEQIATQWDDVKDMAKLEACAA